VRLVGQTQFPEEYWSDLKRRDTSLADEEWLEVECEGQVDLLPMVNAAGVFRVIQSIQSPRAEKIRQWLADSAVQRLDELEDAELAVLGLRSAYEDKGYSPRWIDKR